MTEARVIRVKTASGIDPSAIDGRIRCDTASMTYQWPARIASMIAKWVTGGMSSRGSIWPNVGSQWS